MIIEIVQIVTNILDENRNIKTSSTRESYVLTPETSKILKNVKTGELISTTVCITKKNRITDYIELPITEGL